MMSTKARYLVSGGVLVTLLLLIIAALNLDLRPRSTPPNPLAAAPVIDLAASTTTDTVTVVGTGVATAVPDTATVNLGVSATRGNVHEAVNAANGDMATLVKALHSVGVQDKDIQTASVYIQQVTNCCPSVVTGYTSTNQVNVTVHHLANVSAVIMAVVDAVGNDVQLGGVNLFVANQSAQIAAARAGAMADAGARAQQWARLAGHHLGGLISLSEVVAVVPTYTCDQCGGKGGGGGVPIQPGQTTIAVTVTAVYELLP
jgi:uncharacterized protein YggE